MRKSVLVLTILLILIRIGYSQTDSLFITMDLSNDTTNVSSTFNYAVQEPHNFIAALGNNEFLFTLSISSPRNTDFDLKISLPKESVVVENNNALEVSRPVQITTDGTRIYLEWSKVLNTGEQYSVFVKYKTNSASNDFLFPIFIAVITIILGTGIFAGYKFRSFRKTKFIKEVVNDDEKKIVDHVMKKGEILQEELRTVTGWSKTKISKVVRNLEARNIIEKKPYKKTNKLKIK